jgi:hypothetical protein
MKNCLMAKIRGRRLFTKNNKLSDLKSIVSVFGGEIFRIEILENCPPLTNKELISSFCDDNLSNRDTKFKIIEKLQI